MKWARCSTLTESIWIRWTRRSTRRRWRRSVAPPGRGSAKPCAASVTRRACATESVSGRAIDEHVRAGVRQNRPMAVIRPLADADGGIGRQLIEAARAGLKEAGFPDMRLWVLTGNTRARRFYERAGL